MIFDTLENAKLYRGIHPGIDKILELAGGFTEDNFRKERLEIDGEQLFMNFAEYETHSREGALSEAHRKYADVMYMVSGAETIYVKPTDKLSCITQEYDPKIEALLAKLDDDTTPIQLTAGSFVVLFPGDAHAPGCDPLGESSVSVKKIIGKVLL